MTSAIFREIFVFWIFVLLKELIAYHRWSHMEVQLYLQGGYMTFLRRGCNTKKWRKWLAM